MPSPRILFILSTAAILAAPGLLAAQAGLERVPRATRVTGSVFEDRNANGALDPGEPGLPFVAVSDQVQVVPTGHNGRFALDARGFGLVFVDVPDGYRSAGPFWRSVAGDAAEVSFGLVPEAAPRDFVFVHASDLHVDSTSLPRLRRLRALVDSIRPAFVLITGDLVRDALRVPEDVATGYYRMLTDELARFPVPVHTVPGNHENFGIERQSSHVRSDHPLYGRRMYRSFLGPDYYAFSYGGLRFVGLNTVDYDDQWYYGHVDSLQVRWLEGELARAPRGERIVTFDHIPFVSAGEIRTGFRDDGLAPSLITVDGETAYRHTVRNHEDVLSRIGDRLEIALGGHIHMRESITYRTQAGPMRLQTAAAVVGPPPGAANAYGPLSGITVYRVRDGHVDDGTFVPLDPPEPGVSRADEQTDDWRRGGVCYEVFVRSFQDSDGDGIGDLRGLTRRLDYINDGDASTREDLGADCIWLMPVTQSPSYHGYDVTDYREIESDYGTDADFRELVAEAHRRGIHVVIDMVINHSSREHPWFRSALTGPDSPYRDWYRFADRPGPDNEFGDNNWHSSPVRDEYYFGFFSGSMPDLNWENPAVRAEMERIATFWLDTVGVDGLRLDAVRHLMDDAQGRTTNVPRTHVMLREYGEYVRTHHPDAFTIGEVFDSTDALVPYYPDQMDSFFAFQVSNGILASVRSGVAAPFIDAVTHAQAVLPEGRWSPFLRNHDQSRTMTWLNGDVAGAKLAAGLLLTLPGTPFVYYGEEIGMTGDKPDPRIRTPMQWSHAPTVGFTTGAPWQALSNDSTVTVESQASDPSSLLTLYRDLIHVRSGSAALRTGDFLPLDAANDAIAAYLRKAGDDVVLVVANLGRSAVTPALTSSAGTLPAGSYEVRSLLDGPDAAGLGVGADGRMRGYAPTPSIAPRSIHVYQLARR